MKKPLPCSRKCSHINKLQGLQSQTCSASAWKPNLHPDLHSGTAGFLFDVLGARDYHEGVNRDPASVGVRALDRLTLEVRLEQPVAYFPFIATMPGTYPLPPKTVEELGKTWWQPDTIVSNGPYRLEKYDPHHGVFLVRNSGYYGNFTGNADQVEWTIFQNVEEMIQAYIERRIDC